MAKAVFTHRFGSQYDDLPEQWYHFPEQYLRATERAVGDWVLYYELRRDNGRQSYFATARLDKIERDPSAPDHYYARVSQYLEFARPVPFRTGSEFFESSLQKEDGSTNKGMFGWSVRAIPDSEFDAVVRAGLTTDPQKLGIAQAPETVDGFADAAAGFERPILQRLVNRPFRDAAFARQVKIAYADRCAISGLSLRNGGGRPEVEAAHIRPVEKDGPDTVRNGLALSGTIHWMFDRGLISIADDHSILISSDKLPSDTLERLIVPDRRLILPLDKRDWPHKTYLDFHRREIFSG
jgi:putative restriction endonuclease